MRLFLSSWRAGRHDGELKKFIGSIDKIAVITNAKDYKTPEDRRTKIEENFEYWQSIGVDPTEIDLRPYFHDPDAEKLLMKHNLIWLAGGNVFLLRRALRYTGLDIFLGDMARKNEIILGGESAGAIIMGPTLHYSEMEASGHEDNPDFIPEEYQDRVIWEGLDLINYVPVPHYQDPEYGGEIDNYISRLDSAGIPHKEMTNNQVIIINGDREDLLA